VTPPEARPEVRGRDAATGESFVVHLVHAAGRVFLTATGSPAAARRDLAKIAGARRGA
jgi:hypothetical protein